MNQCGECTECCAVFEIEEINKPKHKLCAHCTSKGCSIYESRPEVCQTFECAYLNSDWKKELRPDKSGVIIAKSLKGEYLAYRLKDDISMNSPIMKQIEYMQLRHGVSIRGIDARKKG